MKTISHWKEIINILESEIDVIFQILDLRNPLGTMNTSIHKYIEKHKLEVDLVYILNKKDMIPKKVLEGWIRYFTKEGYNFVVTSARYSTGLTSIFSIINKNRSSSYRDLNILLVGYPNTGKSCLLEVLTKGNKKVGVSSKAGFTRHLMKIKLKENVFVYDSPGIIPFDDTNETDMALKSCMMAEKLDDTSSVIDAIFSFISIKEFNKTYDLHLTKADTATDFINKLGKRRGILRKGGRIHYKEVEKIVIQDWQSNKLKYYVLPPSMQPKEEIDEESHKDPSKNETSTMMPPSLNFKKR